MRKYNPIIYLDDNGVFCCDLPGVEYRYSTFEIMTNVLRDQGYLEVRLSKGVCYARGYENPHFRLGIHNADDA